MNLMLDLPFGHGAKYLSSAHGAVNQLVGGWQLYWVTFLQSGQYFSPSYSGFDSSNTNTTSGLPDRIADGNLPSGQRTINQWFDTAAFVVPRTGTFGNSGVNILEGPGLNVSHLTVSKNWNLTERVRLRYIAAIADIFNHHNLYFPASNISVPAQAGVISSDYGTGAEGGARRQIEMRLRLEF